MRFTLYGISQYIDGFWDDVVVPTLCNKEWLINLIIQRSGMLYPYQQQPHFLKQNIELWFLRRGFDFNKMFQAMASEYNPIENYDRKEDLKETPDINFIKTGGHTISNTGTNTFNVDLTSTSENNISAYNSSEYSPNNNGVGTHEGTNTNVIDTTDVFNYQDETVHESGTRRHENRVHGNIGVTTNQQMIQSELTLRLYDVYVTIADEFEHEFLMQVY